MSAEETQWSIGRMVWIFAGVVAALAVVIALMLPAVECAREPARRMQCMNRLKNIELAMVLYHEKYGRFPPAYTVDETGKPLHSWRTLLLPFLEQGDLYNDIKLDQPWDSPDNLAVYEHHVIWTYKCPSDPSDSHEVPRTNYVMVLGPDCVSDGPNSCSTEEITNGAGNTLHIVETLVPILWYEPNDLKADEINFKINDETSPGIGSGHTSIVNASCCDGSIKEIAQDTDPEELRKMFEVK